MSKEIQPVRIASIAGATTTTGLLQRACACGQHAIAGAKCSACEKERNARTTESVRLDSRARTVNGLLDQRLTIDPEFDPNLGEPLPTTGRFGPGLTPPPMLTPRYGTCPGATVVERTIDMTPGGLGLGYRTGYGITAVMRVLPGGTNWDATTISERLSAGATTCPASWNLCTGHDDFFVGAPRYSTVLGVLPGQRNRFYDFHTSRWSQSRLHDAAQNPSGLNSCQAVCEQEYLCGGNVIGRHTITRTFRKGTHAGRDVTIVDATKT